MHALGDAVRGGFRADIILLEGNCERGFSAGADIAEFLQGGEQLQGFAVFVLRCPQADTIAQHQQAKRFAVTATQRHLQHAVRLLLPAWCAQIAVSEGGQAGRAAPY